MADLQTLIDACERVLNATSEFVAEMMTSSWAADRTEESKTQSLGLIYRAVCVKQSESLSTIKHLAQRQAGSTSVSLLRAMYEEYVWTKYLMTLPQQEAASVVLALGNYENFQTYKAQAQYKEIQNLPFPSEWVAQSERIATSARAHLEQFFKGHQFRLRKNACVPSFSQIAERVGEKEMYKLLYHATSRAVHFSVPELMRRIWGRPGKFDISSDRFDRYWAAFAIYWGTKLYCLTFLDVLIGMHEIGQAIGDDESIETMSQEVLAAFDDLKKDGAIPIITVEEVAWFN